MLVTGRESRVLVLFETEGAGSTFGPFGGGSGSILVDSFEAWEATFTRVCRDFSGTGDLFGSQGTLGMRALVHNVGAPTAATTL